MPKKKSHKQNKDKTSHADFTINDSANAPKPVSRVKKSMPEVVPEMSWDQFDTDEFDVVEEVSPDGTKQFVYKKKRNASKSSSNSPDDPGCTEYPEILWYLISRYIKPEHVGSFAGINRTTYSITKQASFWRSLYTKYCVGHPKAPKSLCLEDSCKRYGLRPRVIRALYHTYNPFIVKVNQKIGHPHLLVKRMCVDAWYCKTQAYWTYYFKFKKICPLQRSRSSSLSFVEELERIDANPEEDTRVLQVISKEFFVVPPLMGMTLASIGVVLSPKFWYHKVVMGFTSGQHNVSKDIFPECLVTLDTVLATVVFDWWHPSYPNFNTKIPIYYHHNEDSKPVLRKNFLAMYNNLLNVDDKDKECDNNYILTVDYIIVSFISTWETVSIKVFI